MNREIIEKQLTRLFSSAKDGDRTKIGKFGIGFVSVFAIDPHIVCVDTSRDGEHWRVLFGRGPPLRAPSPRHPRRRHPDPPLQADAAPRLRSARGALA
jgi:hypothetical protein